ncbi:MAG TPA: CHAD domain-containing protein [Gemmataceae bacterium]|nr:CHAD domain-containing protein [Gemmataceae bacterium]
MADGKWIAGLTPEMPVADAARVVLAARFEVVRQYLPLAAGQPYEDPEYVHQLRVGTRRAGAALRVFAGCLSRRHLKTTKRYLRTIRRAAGDARDWDVFLKGLTTHLEKATSKGRPAIDFLLGYALGERSAAQSRLEQAVSDAGPSFAPDTATLPAHAHGLRGSGAPRTFGDLAAAQCGELFRAFNTAVDANPDDPRDLHQLRILGKRLRYAIELFVSCFAPPLKDAIYPAVEGLQETLGDLQDAAVGAARLEALRERVKQMSPKEWSRLQFGVEGRLSGLQQKIPAGREQFQAWRDVWAKLTSEHPLESLRLTAVAV